LFLGRDRWWQISESKPVSSFVILSEAKDLNRSITPVGWRKKFSGEVASSLRGKNAGRKNVL
jgi:hypothetical protein